MKTMKKHISFWLAALLLGTSCTDMREDYLMGDTAYFPKSDLQKETLYVMNANDYVYNLWIHKAGYFQTRFAGKVELDYNYLVQYNTENNTNYEMLDEKYYSFDSNFVIEAGVDETAVALRIKTEQLIQEKGYGMYHIPLSVHSLTPGEKTYLEKSNFMLALHICKPTLVIDGNEGEQRGNVMLDLSKSTTEQQIDITAKLDILTTEELDVIYGYNKDQDNLLTAEELPHLLTVGFEYQPKVKIAVGEKYAENTLTLKPSDMPDGKWILPIRIGTDNDKVGVDQTTNWLKLVVVKGSLDSKIPLLGTHAQVNEIILSSEDTPMNEEVADISQFTDMSFTVSDKNGVANPSWIQVTKEQNGKLAVTVPAKNNLTYEERIAVITLVDNKTWLEKKITVRQGMSGYGTILNKSLWSIVGFSDNIADKSATFGRLFDSFWPASVTEAAVGKPNQSYVEVNKNSESSPVQLVLDLGENPHEYNTIGLMPRLQWIGNSPKYLRIEVSDATVARSSEVTDWTLVGSEKREAFTSTDINSRPTGMENQFLDKSFTKWHDLGDVMKHRYIRLSMWDSWNGSICIDEVFVTRK